MTMMGVKLNTKAFGDSQGIEKNNNPVRNLSAQDQQKLGTESVGDALNKLADPNWVDPSKKMRTTGNANLDKDAFFKLMLTQLKNQDPTNPMKSHEMAAQLASFSSLEQMQNMNNTMTEMRNGQKPSENFQALNLLGKAVGGDSSFLTRLKGDQNHDFRFNLGADAESITIKIRNDQGEVIRTLDVKNLKQGENKISWNGQDDKGNPVKEGEYQFFAEAKASNGGKVAVKTDFEGVITGVSYSGDGPVLMVGNQSVKFKDVKKIVDPQHLPQHLKDKETKTLETNELKAVKSSENHQNASMPALNNIAQSVGLSREMMNKIAKEVK